MDREQSVANVILLVGLMNEHKGNARYSNLKAQSAKALVDAFFGERWSETITIGNASYGAWREIRDLRIAFAQCTDPLDTPYVRALLERREIAFADALVAEAWPKLDKPTSGEEAEPARVTTTAEPI